MKGRIILLAAIALLAMSCSSAGDEETTASDGAGSTTTTIESSDDVIEQVTPEQMCRGLDLLAHAGVRPSVAAVSVATVDMDGMTSTEMAQYSSALSSATVSTCPELAEYAVEVIYWLGF